MNEETAIDWREVCRQLCGITYRRKHVEIVLDKCLRKIYNLVTVNAKITKYKSDEDDRCWDVTVTICGQTEAVADDIAAFLDSLHHKDWRRKLFQSVYVDMSSIAFREN